MKKFLALLLAVLCSLNATCHATNNTNKASTNNTVISSVAAGVGVTILGAGLLIWFLKAPHETTINVAVLSGYGVPENDVNHLISRLCGGEGKNTVQKVFEKKKYGFRFDIIDKANLQKLKNYKIIIAPFDGQDANYKTTWKNILYDVKPINLNGTIIFTSINSDNLPLLDCQKMSQNTSALEKSFLRDNFPSAYTYQSVFYLSDTEECIGGGQSKYLEFITKRFRLLI